jgi:ribonuclease VapC
MVVDTSALIAVLREESGFSSYLDAMLRAQRLLMSAASWAEVGVVVLWRLPAGSDAKVRALRERLQLEVAPFDLEQAEVAWLAFRQFGRGRHPAGLNLGDCFAYALAKQRGEPLPFKGDDFTHTDIEPALGT